MSNQGCYNMFLAVALIIGLCHPDHDVSLQLHPVQSVLRRRQPSLWGAATVKKVILFFQTVLKPFWR
ncbi:DUF1304 domain-containing protein [Massilia sp. B-10]|nr:DUF1304 domain-containing protein [Massilia sp. B-10]